MGIELLWSFVAIVAATYVILFGFLKKINEWYYVTMSEKKQNPLPPGHMGWPFIGNMWSFFKASNSQDPDSFIDNLVKRYGRASIYRTHLFGSPSVIVCSQELCRKVLTDDEHFSYGYPSSAIQLGGKKSLYGISNSEHRRLRRLIADPINGHQALALYIGHIEDIVITSLEELATMNRPIKFFNEMKTIALKGIAKVSLGSTQDSSLWSMVKYFTELSPGILSMPINIPGFAFHRALKAKKQLVKLTKDELDERRRKTVAERKKGMMDLLMEVENENGEKLEDEHIIDLLLLILFSGRETVAHNAMWVTIYLHHHPEILQKAKEEQQAIIKRRPSSQKSLTLTEIKEMEYLPKVIDESLRRNYFAFAIFRKVVADVNING
ncbi:beta-amyrin 11-oxidase-like [Gossypium arboreum]|nr:beta-amyrin 11-oxidase-like [Gossypium arboreum]